MQLDNTRIAIRERDFLETLDLALHVTRQFAAPWLLLSLLAIVPLAIINYALIGWMLPDDLDDQAIPWRFSWNMILLIYLEAPLAATFVVAYLGPAVFLEKKSIKQVIGDVIRYSPQIFLTQFLLRGVLPAWLLLLVTDRYSAGNPVEAFLLPVLALYATAMRAFRPYINEIVLLERNPLRSSNPNVITISKRSSHLHGPYSGDLLVRWLGCAGIGLLLAILAWITVVVAQGVLISDWPWNFSPGPPPELTYNLDWFKMQIAYPLCLWFVVAFISVVRFLSYLDLRIRHEGWEVELLMRAEAMRLVARME
jgi:hypothetical protein